MNEAQKVSLLTVLLWTMHETAAATGQRNSTTSGSKSRLTRCLKAPFRALLRARNLYVSSLSKCAGGGTATGREAAVTSFSVGVAVIMSRARSQNAFRQSAHFATSDDDLRELVRASSQGREPHKTVSNVPRSRSVAAVIERIDEDSPYDVDSNKMKTASAYPRSQSFPVVVGARPSGAKA